MVFGYSTNHSGKFSNVTVYFKKNIDWINNQNLLKFKLRNKTIISKY